MPKTKPKSLKAAVRPKTKINAIVTMLSRPTGATIADLAKATDWQQHTVRSVLSRTLVKSRCYKLTSIKAKEGKQRIYRIVSS